MYVKVLQPSGNVKVLYNCIHTNYSLGLEECKHTPVSQSVKTEIEEKFSQGITVDRIMDGNQLNCM